METATKIDSRFISISYIKRGRTKAGRPIKCRPGYFVVRRLGLGGMISRNILADAKFASVDEAVEYALGMAEVDMDRLQSEAERAKQAKANDYILDPRSPLLT